MSLGITIEWERVVLPDGPMDLYLARLVEPHTTANFATLYRQQDGWRVVWYPNTTSDKVKSFDVGSRENGVHRVERWASHHGIGLPAQRHPGRCAFYTYDTSRL